MAVVVFHCSLGEFEEMEPVWRGNLHGPSGESGGFERSFSPLGALEKSVSKIKQIPKLKV